MIKHKIKILFADDSPEIIKLLQQMVGTFGNSWHTEFALGGPEAIDLLEKNKFDVIVTDLEMPEFDGVQLLKFVQKKFPELIRIVFSGHLTKESVRKTSPYTHRFIAKPCGAEKLEQIIDSTLFIHRVLNKKKIMKVLTKTSAVPSVPRIYQELMDRIDDDEFSLKDAIDLISSDVGMSVNILKQINLLGHGDEVTAIDQAVTLLGLDAIKAIALSTHIFESLDSIEIPHFSCENLVRHSMLTAAFAREIALIETDDDEIASTAYVAGVIHDLGTILLVNNFPLKYRDTLARVYESNRPIVDVERNLIGISHAELGAYLLALWGFPEPILRAVAFHENADTHVMERHPILTAVFAANYYSYKFDGDRHVDDEFLQNSAYLQKSNATGRIPLWEERCQSIYSSL